MWKHWPWTEQCIVYLVNKMLTWSMVKWTPVAAISWCQCRALIAGFWSSATARKEMRRFFTLLSKPVKASHALTCQRHRPGLNTGAFERDKRALSCSTFYLSCFFFFFPVKLTFMHMIWTCWRAWMVVRIRARGMLLLSFLNKLLNCLGAWYNVQ